MSITTETERPTFAVEPARLDPGTWCHTAEKTIGCGDIAASYSADRIGEGKPVRKPFLRQGVLWLCTGMAYKDREISAEAYRLVQPQAFKRRITTYADKLRIDGGETARHDPDGFYDGMTVSCNGSRMVLCGPPAKFVQGVKEQMDLFG